MMLGKSGHSVATESWSVVEDLTLPLYKVEEQRSLPILR